MKGIVGGGVGAYLEFSSCCSKLAKRVLRTKNSTVMTPDAKEWKHSKEIFAAGYA